VLTLYSDQREAEKTRSGQRRRQTPKGRTLSAVAEPDTVPLLLKGAKAWRNSLADTLQQTIFGLNDKKIRLLASLNEHPYFHCINLPT